MSDPISSQIDLLPGLDLIFLAEAPVLYHCHHFNLFLDQTIDDALGAEPGLELRTRAAHDAAYQLLEGLSRRLDLRTPSERIQLAQELFSRTGHGTLDIAAPGGEGEATGTHLHYGHSWVDKYGQLVRRRIPVDAVAAGFAAAASEVAHNLPLGTLRAHEEECIGLRDSQCRFRIERAPGQPRTPPLATLATAKQIQPENVTGRFDDRVAQIVRGLREFLAGVSGDERGLVQAFGVFVTLHMANYYNRISYEAVAQLRRRNPALVPVLEALLRESGQVCVFHTFGGILLSPEWEGLVGAPTGDVEEHIIGCTAIARALGFGHWVIEELDPARRLVLRAPMTYETLHRVEDTPTPTSPSCYFMQGAAQAFMELAHRIPWTDHPTLSNQVYRDLFKRGQTWVSEQTRDTARGDAFCEVVVTPKGP